MVSEGQTDESMKWASYLKTPEDGFELMAQMPDAYTKLTNAWVDFANLPRNDRPKEVSDMWKESVSECCNDFFDMFFHSLRMVGLPAPEDAIGKNNVVDMYEGLMFTNTFSSDAIRELFRKTASYSLNTHNSYVRLTRDVLDYSKKVAETNISVDAQKPSWNKADFSEGFIKIWTDFISERTSIGLRLWKSFIAVHNLPVQRGYARC